MPTYSVVAPDGKRYEVTGPKGATNQQVIEQVIKQYPEAAKAHKPRPRQMRPPEQRVAPKQAPRKSNSALGGVVSGALKPFDNMATWALEIPGAKALDRTLADALGLQRSDEAAAKNKEYRANNTRKGWQLVGNIAGTIPAAYLPGGPIVQGAAAGAVLTDEPTKPSKVLRDAVIGGVAGKAGDIVGRKVIAPVAKKAVGAAKKLITPAASTVDDAASPLASLGDDAVARAERFQRVGVQSPTTGMVTRDPRAWYMEQEGLKRLGVGDDLLRQVQSVDDDLRTAGERLMGGFSGDTAEETGKAVQQVLTKKDKQLSEAVGALYKNVRAEKGDVAAGQLMKFRAALEDPDFVDNATFDSMRTTLMRRLERLGLAGNNMQRGNTVTISQAEELRKLIGKAGDGKDATVKAIRGILIDALDDDVVNTVGDDAFKVARGAAKARFDEFRKTFAGDIVEGKIAPERLVPRALSQSKSLDDVRSLIDSLSNVSDEALGQFRGQALRDVIAPAIPREGGPMASTLQRNFNANSTKLRELLPPDQYAQLDDFVQAVADARSAVPNSNVNYSNTGSTVANMFPDVAGSRSRLRDIISVGARLVGGGTGGAPGYAAAEVADRSAQALAQRRMATAVAQQAKLAADPNAAAQALAEAQARKAAEELVRRYGDILGPLLGGPAAAAAVSAEN